MKRLAKLLKAILLRPLDKDFVYTRLFTMNSLITETLLLYFFKLIYL